MRIIVTGASGALGKGVTSRLRALGHTVAGLDRHGEADVQVCGDLAQTEEAERAIGIAVDRLGGLDALVHLVGGFEWKKIEDLSLDKLRGLFSINVETYFSSARAALKHIGDGGAIVAIGAAAAQNAAAGMGGYAAAKSAVARLTEALAQELRDRRIRVNAVLPSIIDTPRNRADMPDADPAGWTSPEAIADVIGFLLSNEARAINGASVPVTNGTQ